MLSVVDSAVWTAVWPGTIVSRWRDVTVCRDIIFNPYGPGLTQDRMYVLLSVHEFAAGAMAKP
jgi:hypothetical protein